MIGDSLSLFVFGREIRDHLMKRVAPYGVALYAACSSSPETWIISFRTKCGGLELTPDHERIVKYRNFYNAPTLKDLLFQYSPQTVIIQLGTNWMDALAKATNQQQFADIQNKYSKGLDELIEVIRGGSTPNPTIIWIMPPDAKFSTKVKETVQIVWNNRFQQNDTL
jgi:hypothetical protein